MDANCVGGVGRGVVSGSDGICDVGGGRDSCGGGGGDSFGETNSDSGSDIGIFFGIRVLGVEAIASATRC